MVKRVFVATLMAIVFTAALGQTANSTRPSITASEFLDLQADVGPQPPASTAGAPAALDFSKFGTPAPKAAQRPMTWDEVLRHQDMQGLSSDRLEAARNQYFLDVVAPHVPTEHLRAERAAFDADTAPGPVNSAMRYFRGVEAPVPIQWAMAAFAFVVLSLVVALLLFFRKAPPPPIVSGAEFEGLRQKIDGNPVVRAAVRSALNTIEEKHRVNTKQRRIAIATLAVIVLSLAFPPFDMHLQNGVVTNLGYAFIFSPPDWRGLVGSVDVGMLAAEWLAAVLVGATLCWLHKDG